jgi:multisubunit Na+/H+ antiporter MnhF subunit
MLLAMYVTAFIFISALSTSIVATIAVSRPETVLSNRVIIYGLLSSLDVAKLAKVINKFPTI